jgi:hypothetical protein
MHNGEQKKADTSDYVWYHSTCLKFNIGKSKLCLFIDANICSKSIRQSSEIAMEKNQDRPSSEAQDP